MLRRLIALLGLFALTLTAAHASPFGDLIDAVAHDNNSQVVALIKAHPELVKEHAAYGLTVLHMAASKGRVIILGELIDAGGDVNAQSQNGETPLHAAAYAGKVKAIELLLRHGANPNLVARTTPYGLGGTPLHQAVRQAELDAARALLTARRLNVNLLDPAGHTALWYARDEHFPAMVTLLGQHGAKSR
jgi:ankyrin repeat protein